MTTGATEELRTVVARSLDAVAAADSLDGLTALETELLGKRSALATRKAALGALAPEERREAGRSAWRPSASTSPRWYRRTTRATATW
jgi:hypothetical protein